VWLSAGDPLADASGAGVARWLTALGVAGEYAPASAASATAAGAVAHLSRGAVAASDAEWAAWRARFPLLGVTVAVTRAAAQAAPLVAALSDRGADALACPTIEITGPADPGALDEALGAPGRYAWAVFTSATGVERFFGRMAATGGDLRDLKGVRLAAIGPATAAALVARGLRVDLVPDEYVAEALFAALEREGPLAGARVLVARAAVARDVLPDALRAAGAEVDVVEAYRTVRPDESRDLLATLLDGGRLDLVSFTSSSTVGNFVDLVGAERARRAPAACIGPVTAETARAAGLDVVAVADRYTVDGLVEAVTTWAARR
jgi:uroporphyrinogen III methyltransferase/synthase